MTRAYICLPLFANTKEEMRENMLQARFYMKLFAEAYGYRTYAPHAYLPELLDDKNKKERAIALSFGRNLLKLCQIVVICGEKISEGMKQEIALAFQLGKKIYYWKDFSYMELQPVSEWRQIDAMQVQK